MARANSTTIKAGVQVIDLNTTLNVATTGSDVTGDGSVGNPFATPHKAYDYLQGFRIKEGVTVTINCAAGTYTFTDTLEVSHPQGKRITLKGAALTGAAPVESDFVAAAATNETFLRGRYATVFEFDSVVIAPCVDVEDNGAIIEDICFIRTQAVSGNGLRCTSGEVTFLGSVSFHGFASDVLYAIGSGATLRSSGSSLTVTNSTNTGILTFDGACAIISNTIVAYCNNGIQSDSGSMVDVNGGCVTRDNTGSGFRSLNGASMFITTTTNAADGNGIHEYYCANHSFMYISNASLVSGAVVYANNRSYIETNNVAGVSYSPAFGVAGNTDSLIS